MKRTFILLAGFFWVVMSAFPAVAQEPVDADRQAMGNTFQAALENNPTNQASTWVNPDTGSSGSAVPVKTFQNAYGQPCREFQQTIIIAGQQQEGYGTACRQPDGSWQIVAPNQAGGTAASSTGGRAYTSETRVYNQYYTEPYPVAYAPAYPPVRYYDPWYGYPAYYPWPFSLSFGYVYYGGHSNGGHGGGHKHYGGHRGNWGQRGGHGGGGHWSGGRGGGGHGGGNHGSWSGRGGGGNHGTGSRGGGGHARR